jgi:hypothetical protein
MYDLYEMQESETNQTYEGHSLSTFMETYIQEPVPTDVEIMEVSIFKDGETICQIGNPITVLVFEPGKTAYSKNIHDTRKSYSAIVGGDTEYVTIGRGEYILVCNEVGMLIKLPQHRGFYGTFFVTANIDGYCGSMTESDVETVKGLLDKKENFESKSTYLKEYFQNKPVPRKMFSFQFDNLNYHVWTESVIEFLLLQEEKEKLQMIELEIRDIERNQKDIYSYLESIAYQMGVQQNKELEQQGH